MKLQNLIHILIGIVCVGLLPNAPRLVAQSRRVDGALQHEQTTGQSNHGLPANIIVVTNTNDSGPGSLRQALAVANDGDTIDATGVSGTILLTSGELQITHNVTITGPGAGNLAVNGDATYRVFENFASNVAISGFTITNGSAASDNFDGGGILNHGGLTVSDSSIVSNTAIFPPGGGGQGGGIYSTGGGTPTETTVTNSTISNNVSSQIGGGIAVCCGANLTVTSSVISNNVSQGGGGIAILDVGLTLTVTNSVISGNQSSSYGGGISAETATVTVSNSTISGNVGECEGGGIWTNMTQLMVTSSTISGNSSSSGGDCEGAGAGFGGGIYSIGSSGTLMVTSSTISGNSAMSEGGGIWNGRQITSLAVKDSTFSGNSAPGGGGTLWNNNEGMAHMGGTVLNAGPSGGTIVNFGTFISLGYNLASDGGGGVLTGPGDQIGINPRLGPLQDNGGPTFTHELLTGSPAINAGDPSFTPPPFYDQRGPGFDRVRNGRIDIGSFEVQDPPPTPTATPTTTPTVTPTPSATPRPSPTPRHMPSPRLRPTPVPRP